MALVWLVPLLFFAIAFVFSMLGMGGSQLYIPILFWAGLDLKTEAIPLGMLLNVVNSATAAVTYGRRRMIAWHTALPIAAIMLAFAPIGAWINVRVSEALLLILFALFTIVAAVLMLSGWRPSHQHLPPVVHASVRLAGGGAPLVSWLASSVRVEVRLWFRSYSCLGWKRRQLLPPRHSSFPVRGVQASFRTLPQPRNLIGLCGLPVLRVFSSAVKWGLV